MKKNNRIDWKFITIVFLAWRLVISLGELIGFAFVPFKYSFPYIDSMLESTKLPQWLWQWGNFDGVHYLDIVINGYHGYGGQVFFPGYPLIVKAASFLISSPLIAALAVSHLAIFLAAAFLYRLVHSEYGSSVAHWSVVFLFLFPTSFFFGAIYTESLFLLLTLLAFTSSGLPSALFGLLAGGTRLVGFFIAPARILLKPRNWWSLFAVGGLGSYVLYLYWRFSEPLIFLEAQSAFQNSRASSISSLVNPAQVIVRYLKIFFTADFHRFSYWIATLEFVSFVFGLAFLVYLYFTRKMRYTYLFFGVVALILPTVSGTFSSMPRYLLTAFPIFIGLALLKSKLLKFGILTAFIVLLLLLTSLFTRGYFVS